MSNVVYTNTCKPYCKHLRCKYHCWAHVELSAPYSRIFWNEHGMTHPIIHLWARFRSQKGSVRGKGLTISKYKYTLWYICITIHKHTILCMFMFCSYFCITHTKRKKTRFSASSSWASQQLRWHAPATDFGFLPHDVKQSNLWGGKHVDKTIYTVAISIKK